MHSRQFYPLLVTGVVVVWLTQPLAAISTERNDGTTDLNKSAKTGILLFQGKTDGGLQLEKHSAALRKKMIKEFGGSVESEAAVALALAWFAEHQLRDGGWSFDHRLGGCEGRCSHHGSAANARNAAAALGLLPFLGAGQTHMEGKYKKAVDKGLEYLIANQKAKQEGGSFHEGGGSMYSHGLATIALCEAYSLTHDKKLFKPAQAAVDFIVDAQDPVGGGWRYSPKSAGDTSVTGWQLLALRTADGVMLVVPPKTFRGATKFLDSVSTDGGAFFGYTGPGKGQATTAIGLLGRMHLGVGKEDAGLKRGITWLGERGPSKGDGRANMYYNYYANEAMRQYGGEHWKKWNKGGHANGSWFWLGDHGAERGGTSLATLILESYYRHHPVNSKGSGK